MTENPIHDVLEMDSDVDDLSALQVKDAWGRMRLMLLAQRERGVDVSAVEQHLSDLESQGLKEVALRAYGRNHPIPDALGWEAGRGNVETLFAQMALHKWVKGYDAREGGVPNVITAMDDLYREVGDGDRDAGEEQIIGRCREMLKEALKGTGTPEIVVARERVKHYRDE